MELWGQTGGQHRALIYNTTHNSGVSGASEMTVSKGFTAQWMTRGSGEAGLALSWFTESVFCFSGVRQDIYEVLDLFKTSLPRKPQA